MCAGFNRMLYKNQKCEQKILYEGNPRCNGIRKYPISSTLLNWFSHCSAAQLLTLSRTFMDSPAELARTNTTPNLFQPPGALPLTALPLSLRLHPSSYLCVNNPSKKGRVPSSFQPSSIEHYIFFKSLPFK